MKLDVIYKELVFKAVRSSGAGGQHVNKVSSKVLLTFNVLNSEGLTDEEKNLLKQKLGNRLSKQGELQLQSSQYRSQHQNKKRVIQRLVQLLESMLVKAKKRIPTKPSKRVIIKRLENKKRLSDKKALRRKPL